MKIHILYKFVDGPWGGGNQFLKALRKAFINQNIYEENIKNADIILFNSYPFNSENLFDEIFKLKIREPEKIILHRIDGPVFIVRGKNTDKPVDKIINLFINNFVDGIIFQSNWCKEQNKRYFKISAKYETVIYNAPDNTIFNKIGKKEFNQDKKIKLIATSWSSNWRKGFKIYKFLDENLDFSKYEMTFVGSSPVEFRNIKYIKPVSSEKLSKILKQYDIYITASQNDPCSNSLIEALSCGLPSVVLNHGGHPELVQNGGELFNDENDVIEKIETVAKNYQYYQSKIKEFNIEKVAEEYVKFAKMIYDDIQEGKYKPKKVNFLTRLNFYRIKYMIIKWKVMNRIKSYLKVL